MHISTHTSRPQITKQGGLNEAQVFFSNIWWAAIWKRIKYTVSDSKIEPQTSRWKLQGNRFRMNIIESFQIFELFENGMAPSKGLSSLILTIFKLKELSPVRWLDVGSKHKFHEGRESYLLGSLMYPCAQNIAWYTEDIQSCWIKERAYPAITSNLRLQFCERYSRIILSSAEYRMRQFNSSVGSFKVHNHLTIFFRSNSQTHKGNSTSSDKNVPQSCTHCYTRSVGLIADKISKATQINRKKRKITQQLRRGMWVPFR